MTTCYIDVTFKQRYMNVPFEVVFFEEEESGYVTKWHEHIPSHPYLSGSSEPDDFLTEFKAKGIAAGICRDADDRTLAVQVTSPNPDHDPDPSLLLTAIVSLASLPKYPYTSAPSICSVAAYRWSTYPIAWAILHSQQQGEKLSAVAVFHHMLQLIVDLAGLSKAKAGWVSLLTRPWRRRATQIPLELSKVRGLQMLNWYMGRIAGGATVRRIRSSLRLGCRC
jgi:hypothetical protein